MLYLHFWHILFLTPATSYLAVKSDVSTLAKISELSWWCGLSPPFGSHFKTQVVFCLPLSIFSLLSFFFWKTAPFKLEIWHKWLPVPWKQLVKYPGTFLINEKTDQLTFLGQRGSECNESKRSSWDGSFHLGANAYSCRIFQISKQSCYVHEFEYRWSIWEISCGLELQHDLCYELFSRPFGSQYIDWLEKDRFHKAPYHPKTHSPISWWIVQKQR